MRLATDKTSKIVNPKSSSSGPLLKWAGGKRQLLPELRRFYPKEFRNYIEPFVGSGAVFFDLHASGRLQHHDVYLIDSNADLIGCYEQVRDHAEEVAHTLEDLAGGHRHAGAAFYYEVRDRRFNPRRDQQRVPDGGIRYTPDLAAMFIYLNRTGFNGLFRLNARGGFNVPPGRYEHPKIFDRSALMHVAAALASPGVHLECGSFEAARTRAGRGDFLYIDPPYAPVSRTANFTAYTAARFDAAAHRQLQALVIDLAGRGCQVLLSNSTAATIAALYDANAETSAAGLRALRIPARRAINSNAARRGPVEEFLITNIRI